MTERHELSELLRVCAAGDSRAFERLYRLVAPRLYSLCLRLLRRRDLAEEVLQEGFVRIWRRAGDYDPGVASAMAWMSTIVRNHALDRLRSRDVGLGESTVDGEGLDFEAPDCDPEVLAGHSLAARRLADCLKLLQENQRQAIYLAYFHGQTHEEIAAFKNTPLGTVKAWVRRGVERLRQCLE